MLKVRIIPTLLWKNVGLVKGVAFNSWRNIGSVLPAIKVYNNRDVDELILLDILGHRSNDEPDIESINEFGQDCFVPFTVGGGIKNSEQVQSLLRAGADKIAINTELYSHPEIINKIANRHGSQCVVASVDVRKDCTEKKWHCFSHAGQQATGRAVCEWCKELENRGAGEILLTSIERDGTMSGYDLELIESVVNTVDIPVIASGGAGNYQHMIKAVIDAGASAVAAASMFHFTEQTPAGAKAAMLQAGIPIRSGFIN